MDHAKEIRDSVEHADGLREYHLPDGYRSLREDALRIAADLERKPDISTLTPECWGKMDEQARASYQGRNRLLWRVLQRRHRMWWGRGRGGGEGDRRPGAPSFAPGEEVT